MVSLRALLNFIVAGALVGILVVTLVGPNFIAWDNTAGAASAMCLCGETARLGANTLITYQMRGVGGGALLGAIAGAVFLMKRKKPAKPAAPEAGAPT
jgi:hypothetical protein